MKNTMKKVLIQLFVTGTIIAATVLPALALGGGGS